MEVKGRCCKVLLMKERCCTVAVCCVAVLYCAVLECRVVLSDEVAEWCVAVFG